MRRRLITAAILLLATLGGMLLLLPLDPLEAARRRVPLGADEQAVVAAVGRPADGVSTELGPDAGLAVRALFWRYGDDILFVDFDKDGRAVSASIHAWRALTLWDRVKAWWSW
jgi:hypothetical protein